MSLYVIVDGSSGGRSDGHSVLREGEMFQVWKDQKSSHYSYWGSWSSWSGKLPPCMCKDCWHKLLNMVNTVEEECKGSYSEDWMWQRRKVIVSPHFLWL